MKTMMFISFQDLYLFTCVCEFYLDYSNMSIKWINSWSMILNHKGEFDSACAQ